ncbi:MAG: DUF4129 domain-containing protein [Chloroflexota bacterium]
MSLWHRFRNNQAWSMGISYAAIVGMMTCVAFSVLPVTAWLLPDAGAFIPALAFAVSLEGLVSFRIVRHLSRENQEHVFFRVSEIIVLVLSMKLLVELRHGVAHFVDNLVHWQSGFLDNFFSPEYTLVVGLMALLWGCTWWYAADLSEMESDEFILSAASLEAVPSNRRGVHRAIVGRVLTVGWLLVVLNVAGQYDFSVKTFVQDEAGFFAVLLYFVCGLVLLSQTNFAAWRAAWGYARASIPENLAKRWLLYSLAFLLVVLAVAIVLPTSYAYRLFPTLSYLLNLLFALVYFFVSLLAFPLILLLSFLGSLFPSIQAERELLPVEPFPPSLESVPAAPMPWWELFKSIIFWATFAAIVAVALAQYLRQNEQAGLFLRRIFRWRWAMLAWNWLRETFSGARQNLAKAVQAGIDRLRAVKPVVPVDAWRFVNPRRLSTRQRIIFYYVALVRRAGEAGTPRQPSQTPREYYRSLVKDQPALDAELAALTDAFYDARYSEHLITEAHASFVRRVWERIRRALRRKG